MILTFPDFIVSLGEREKKPRLQGKTLVCLRYGELQEVQSHSLRYQVSRRLDHEIPQAGFGGAVAERVRDLIREICRVWDVEILKGHVSTDHVHIFVSVPPHISVSDLVKAIKGKTSQEMLMECKALSRAFWGRHMWAGGYFVASSGQVTDETIMNYLEQQGKEPPDGDFRVAGEL